MINFTVSLSIEETKEKIRNNIEELIDEYTLKKDHCQCCVLVFEKYYFRMGSRASLTVTIDNFSGATTIHAVGTGSSHSVFFRFDWGVTESYEAEIQNLFLPFIQ